MPAVGRREPGTQAQSELINNVNKQYEELKQVYSKKALDQTFEDIFITLKRFDEDVKLLSSRMDKMEIQIVNHSPWSKFRNLFRRS